MHANHSKKTRIEAQTKRVFGQVLGLVCFSYSSNRRLVATIAIGLGQKVSRAEDAEAREGLHPRGPIVRSKFGIEKEVQNGIDARIGGAQPLGNGHARMDNVTGPRVIVLLAWANLDDEEDHIERQPTECEQ